MDKCHFIGIGGIGMSGLAKIMLSKKIPVSGSDLSESKLTEKLTDEGATVYIGHAEDNIEPNTTVIYSSGISKENPEYIAAIDKKCRLIHRSDLLKQIMEEYKTLAVAGTHGKTTTAALLTAVLKEAQLDPSFAVGGMIPQFETNGDLGTGEYFIAEADESDGTFLKYHSHGAILTNIGLDHMDYFGAIETLISAFQTFISQVESSELLFWCGDDKRLRALSPKGVCYGFGKENDLRIVEYRQEGWRCLFDIKYQGYRFEEVELALTGRHNALNALAVFGLALRLGVKEKMIRRAFKTFGGVSRRCEKKGAVSEVLVLDDYAHHPEEIRATLRGMRCAIEERRLVTIFQPHRYSRTKDNLGQYGTIFNHSDLLIVTDIYAAGEPPIDGITHQQIIDEVSANSKVPVKYVPKNQIVATICKELRPHDVVATLGAGDITKIGPEIIDNLRSKPPKKWKVGLIFGGRSAEHEISLRSARYMRDHLNTHYYDIAYFGITKEGHWLDKDESQQCLGEKALVRRGAPLGKKALEELVDCDILLPVLHGPFGEDGTIQGLFEMLGKPYVGCSHRAASVAMDKVLAKRIIMLSGIATPHYVDFTQHEWENDPLHLVGMVHQQLEFPVFVKPIHLGSTIGVSKVNGIEELPKAIEQAFLHDHKVLVESGIDGREIEVAVYGNDHVHVLPPGEVLRTRDIYDYESKYGTNACGYNFELDLPQELIDEVMFLAEKIYQAVECSGLARIDFFLDSKNRFWFSEINPMPGFTESSMYPQVLEAFQIKGTDMIDRLIRLGFQRMRAEQNRAVVI